MKISQVCILSNQNRKEKFDFEKIKYNNPLPVFLQNGKKNETIGFAIIESSNDNYMFATLNIGKKINSFDIIKNLYPNVNLYMDIDKNLYSIKGIILTKNNVNNNNITSLETNGVFYNK